MNTCAHNWEFQHVVYWYSHYSMPGSSAYERYYGDKYFCTHCLEQKIVNERTDGNSYTKPIQGTFPK